MSLVSQLAEYTTVSSDRADSRNQSLRSRAEDNLLWGQTIARVEVLALEIFGSASFIMPGSLIYAVAQGFAASFAVPLTIVLIVAGGVSFVICTQIFDYESEEELEKYRNHALQTFGAFHTLNHVDATLPGIVSRAEDPDMDRRDLKILQQIASKHSWKNMFYYGIPQPSDFERMYRYQADRLEVNELIELYELVSTEYENARGLHGEDLFQYTIPHPREWSVKFKHEIVNQETGTLKLSLEEILTRYDLSKLQELELIDAALMQHLTFINAEHIGAKETFESNTVALRSVYESQVAIPQEQLKKKKEQAESRYQDHTAFNTLLSLRMKEVEAINLMNYRIRQDDPEFNSARTRRREVLQALVDLGHRDIDALPSYDRETFQVADELYARMNRVHAERYLNNRQGINQRFERERAPHSHALTTAKGARDQAIRAAQAQFETETGSRTAEYQSLVLEHQNTLNAVTERQTQRLLGNVMF